MTSHTTQPVAVVVNDDPTQLGILAGLLGKAQIDARTFEGVEAALAAMDPAVPPDLIVTDLYMPDIDGWRFCRLLRSPEYAAFNEVPILIVSATFAGEHPERIATDTGADAFLPSPVDGKQFVAQAQALIEGTQERRKPSVLIIEDDEAHADLLQKAFQANGYRTSKALTARVAEERFKKSAYDVAVLDHHLPDGTGDDMLEARTRQLRESEEKYRSLFDQSASAVYLHDLEGQLQDANEIACEQLGYSRDELLRLTIFDLHPARENTPNLPRDEILRHWRQWQPGERHTFQGEHQRKDGTIIPVEVSTGPVRVAGQTLILAMVNDITERKRAEHLLRVERDLAQALTAAGDLDETLSLCLDAAIAGSGLDAGGVYLVEPETGAITLRHHRGLSGAFIEAAKRFDADSPQGRIIRAGKPVYTCYRETGVDMNGMLPAETIEAIAIVPICHHGQVIGCLNVASHTHGEVPEHARGALEKLAGQMGQAIAERQAEEALRDSEEKHRRLFETMAQGVIYQNADGEIISANPAAEKILGLTFNQMRGKTSMDPRWKMILEDGTPVPGPEHPTMVALRTGQTVGPVTRGVFHPDKNAHVWLSIRAIPLFAPGAATPFQAYATFTDITGRRRSEERLHALNETLLTLGDDFEENTERLTALCGTLMGATCALYNRLEGDVLCAIGHWQTPPDFQRRDKAEGHLCHDVIQKAEKGMVVVHNLSQTPYAETDPNVERYGLETYMGHPVYCQGRPVGALCAVFQSHVPCTPEDERLFGIMATALGAQEERRLGLLELVTREERFQRMLAVIPDMVSIHDPEMNIVYSNWNGFAAVPEHKRILNTKCYQTYRDRDAICPDCKAMDVLSTKQPVQSEEKLPDGTWIDLRVLPLFDEDGQLEFFVEWVRDITQQKLSEERIQHQASLITSLLDSIPDIVFYKDLHGMYLGCNAEFARHAGRSKEAIVGHTDFELYSRDDAEAFRGNDRKALESNRPRHNEEWITYPDGRKVLLDTLKTPYRDAAGNLVGVIGVSRDITEQKQAAERRQVQADTFARIASSGHLARGAVEELAAEITETVSHALEIERVGVWLFDPGQTQLICVDTYHASTGGHDSGAVLHSHEHRNEFDALTSAPYVDAHDALTDPRTAGYAETYLEPNRITSMLDASITIEGRNLGTLCLEHVDKAHHWTDDEIAFACRIADQMALAILHRERDQAIEALRESEAQYRGIIETAMDGFWLVTLDGRLLRVNDAYCRMSGYSFEELTGMMISDIEAVETPDETAERIQKLQTLGKDFFETRHRRKDGSVYDVEVSVQYHSFESGQIFAFIRDITERKRAEQALRESEGRVRQKLAALLLPEGDIGALELADIIDAPVIQGIMDDFFNLTHIGVAVVDLSGKVLVATGWQDICTRFHRMHPETNRNCIESDTRLVEGVAPGTFKAYKCKNNMWDMATPIVVGGKHIGNVFLGQFLYEGEAPEYETFRAKARQYGFDEEAYLEALDRVPRWSRETVEHVMGFYSRFAALISSLSYANLKLARTLEDHRRMEAALRESEAYNRSMIEAIPDIIIQTNAEGEYLDIHAASENHLFRPASEVLGKKAADVLPEEPARRIMECIQEVLKTEKLHAVEYELTVPAGQLCFEARIVPMDGQRAFVLVRDITASKRGEEERAHLQAQLNQAQKMESVGRLAGGVAHDFNNMLGVILGHAELALMSLEPTQEIYEDIAEIQKAAQRSADLTRQLLAFARKQTVIPRVLDLNQTIEGMLKMLRRLIGEDIELTWKPGKNLWAVKIDPSQVDQVLANLCVNARDAIAGVGKITIATANAAFDEEYCARHQDFSPGEYVLLAVTDTGCGMDSEMLAHVFEPFFTSKEKDKGTGLGLATVYGAVTQNRGFIKVYSEPDQGTTFNIYLPRHATEPVASPEQSAGTSTPRGSETVLLVEDEPAILDMPQQCSKWTAIRFCRQALPARPCALPRTTRGVSICS